MALDRVVIELLGTPVAKGRPRFARIGKGAGSFVTSYTPGKTRKYEDQVKFVAGNVMNGRPLLTGALYVRLTAFLPVPQSWSKKKQGQALNGDIFPTKRPDLDNFAKVLDALNCVVFADDSQIVRSESMKVYSDRPRLLIEVVPFPEAA